jgi:hypothetical protein
VLVGLGYASHMSEEQNQPDPAQPEDAETDGVQSDGVNQKPRGNPETDQEAVDKGVEQLDRVKPY